MKWHIILIFGFLLWQIVLKGQSTDSLNADGLTKDAIACLKRGQPDSAIVLHHKALAIFEAHNLWAAWMQSHVKIAYVWSGPLKQPFVGIDYIERALSQYPKRPKSQAEWEQICLTYLAEGFIYEEYVGNFLPACKQYEKGFQIFVQQLGERNDKIAGYIYYKYGDLCTRLGDYERASTILKRGIDYEKKYQVPNVGKYGDLAIVLLELNENHQAIEIAQEGLLNKKALAEPTITLRRSEARAYLNLGNIPAARSAAGHIPALIRRMKKEEGSTDEAYYWSGYFEILASIEESSGRYVQAATNYKQAIRYETQTWGTPYRREVGKLYWTLGDLYLRQNKPLAALREFQQTLRCVLPDFKPVNDQQNPSESLFNTENTILEALHGKARAFQALNQLDKALECYELIPIVEAKLRATHAYESSSLLALKESRQRFQEAVDIAWQLFERSNGNPQYTERAFRLTELARGMLLLQSLIQARQYLPDSIQSKGYDLQVRMAWLEHEIAAEQEKVQASKNEKADKQADNTKINDLERQLFDLKLERQKLLADFPAYDHPDSLFLQVLAAKDVRNLLRDGQSMVDFFLTETTAYIFSFDAMGDFRWRRAALPPQFREQTKDFVGYLWAGKEAGRDKFLHHAWLLDSLLLEPERSYWGTAANSLMVVPDDILMLVPFEVLLSRPILNNRPWRDQPWLLYEYNIGYAYSATLLKVQKDISEEHAIAAATPAYTFGGFAPTYSNSSSYKLENTAPMVKNVQSELGGEAWLNTESSEERFKNEAAQYRILLLAMHGISDNENPELSRLLFGDAGPDSLINNNILYASELQIMRLQADLVVLSACHTGSGKLEQGEGVYSLARAFAAARVPATVMSLWLLHASMAPPLVEAFFKYLQQGKTKDEALKLAKSDFLKNDENFEMTHPFYWAGLAASGDMRALELPARSAFEWQFWWLILPIPMIVVGLWWWKRKRRILQ